MAQPRPSAWYRVVSAFGQWQGHPSVARFEAQSPAGDLGPYVDRRIFGTEPALTIPQTTSDGDFR